MRKVELLPTRDCEAGYGPGVEIVPDSVAESGLMYLSLVVSAASLSEYSSLFTVTLWIWPTKPDESPILSFRILSYGGGTPPA